MGEGRNVGRPRFSLSKDGVKKGEAENQRLQELLAKEKETERKRRNYGRFLIRKIQNF